MDLPVRFPSDTEVILEEVARMRALPVEEQARTYRSFLKSAAHLLARSPKAAWARRFADEQEELARRSIRDFIERHGR